MLFRVSAGIRGSLNAEKVGFPVDFLKVAPNVGSFFIAVGGVHKLGDVLPEVLSPWGGVEVEGGEVGGVFGEEVLCHAVVYNPARGQ